jgi:putative acetyltransferase
LAAFTLIEPLLQFVSEPIEGYENVPGASGKSTGGIADEGAPMKPPVILLREVCTLIEIREERPGDVESIRDVNKCAFGQDLEGKIVDALRSNGAALLSLVATQNGKVVGHIIYSPASVGDEVTGAALGPMAVHPEHQRQGIGIKLVEAGNRKLQEAGHPFIIVVGHANYYPRFGFRPASTHGIQCEWEVPDEVFMMLILDEAKMQGVSGLAKYRHEFSSVY